MLVVAMVMLCGCTAYDFLGGTLGEAIAEADQAPAKPQAKPLGCYDNLCGDAMLGEVYCSCHDAAPGPKQAGSPSARCWSQVEDCKVDLTCCQAGAVCNAQGTDTCSQATHNERAKRDAAAAANPPPKAPTIAPPGRAYLSIPTTHGPPDIPDCNDGELMVDTLQRHLWVCTHKTWWHSP